MAIFRVGPSGDDPLEAAAAFYREDVPRLVGHEEGHLMLVFPPADYTHRAWRAAAVQQLARHHAPHRVNAVASDDEPAIAAAARYFGAAPAITGHYLRLDGEGAELVVG